MYEVVLLTANHWESLREQLGFGPIATKQEHKKATQLLEYMHDRGAMSEDHELHGLWSLVSMFVHEYELKTYPLSPDVTGSEMLRFLMEQHNLKQVDLKNELGSQSVVSDVLSGKRELNRRQIIALCARFHVKPDVFF